MPLYIYDKFGILKQSSSGGFTSFTLNADSGTPQTVENAETLLVAGSNGIVTSVGATNQVTVSGAAFVQSITAAGDTGTPQTISNGNTLSVLGGAGLSTVASATDNITVNSAWNWEQTLGANGSFDIDLTTITGYDANVTKLEIQLGIRGAVSALSDQLYIFMNNDLVLTNYYRQTHGASAGAATLGQANELLIAVFPAATSPAGAFGSYNVTVNNPRNTNMRKVIKIEGAGELDATTLRVENGAVTWRNTAAITRIQVRSSNNPTNLIATNSIMRIRFIK